MSTLACSLKELRSKQLTVDILDTDYFSPVAKIMRGIDHYKLSSYMPDRPPGTVDPSGVYNVDLQDMFWPDRTFDVILSSDVMEHVRDFKRASREIFRSLKPGGAHIFTVPFHDPRPLTRTLVDTSTERDIYLEPPQVHGDDNLTAGVPANRIYGLDLIDELKTLGFDARIVRLGATNSGIYDESYFLARRPA